MISQQVIAQPEESIDKGKATRDLGFIKSLQQLANQNQWRIVVSGGYGLDILLGKITRNHNDVDIILYGNSVRDDSRKQINDELGKLLSNPQITTKDEDFYLDIDAKSPGFGANIYFVQTVNDPHIDIHRVMKLDGVVVTNTEDRFPSPVVGRLDDLVIEVQNPHTHLADILFKRKKLENRLTHNQDIKNLELLTDKSKVETILALM